MDLQRCLLEMSFGKGELDACNQVPETSLITVLSKDPCEETTIVIIDLFGKD